MGGGGLERWSPRSVTDKLSFLYLIELFVPNFALVSLLYPRCKLQKAFYTRTSSGCIGCGGINCADFFPMISPYKRENYEELKGEKYPEKETLTIKDLANIKPYYVCNVLVDNWIYVNSPDPRISFTVLTISPHLIERIDDDENKDFDHNSIGPGDIRLSDAMATSGAVLSYNMGNYENEAALSLQIMLGVSMGKTWLSDKRLMRRTFFGAVCILKVNIAQHMYLIVVRYFFFHFK